MMLVLKYWREGAITVLVLALVASCVARDHRLRAAGAATERTRVADSVLVVNRSQLVRVDTLLIHDTVTVRRTVAHLDTLRDTLLAHLTDTIVVKEFVKAADVTAKACSELSGDCAEFRRLANQRFAAYEAKLATVPPPRTCTWSNVTLGAIGLGVGYLAHR